MAEYIAVVWHPLGGMRILWEAACCGLLAANSLEKQAFYWRFHLVLLTDYVDESRCADVITHASSPLTGVISSRISWIARVFDLAASKG